MLAWRLHELGEPSRVLRIDTLDSPEPKDGSVILDTAAVGLSFPDVLTCRGEYQVKPELPHTPGGETAGTVVAVGAGVEGLDVGRRVMCLGGGLADQVQVSASLCFPIPDGLAFHKAAAIPVNYGTTWFALHGRAHLQPGETLLITGASGGTGSAAIQLGKAAGATVIAVAGGDEKAANCKALGADVVIDHRATPQWVDVVKEATGGKGVDVAYDPVGGDTFHQVRRCMAWDGRLLIIGFVDAIADAPTNHVLLKNYSIVGVHWGASLAHDFSAMSASMAEILALTETGAVDPLVYPPYAFADAAQALQDLADRKVYGKAVVTL